jgi:hypothetical protein
MHPDTLPEPVHTSSLPGTNDTSSAGASSKPWSGSTRRPLAQRTGAALGAIQPHAKVTAIREGS